MPPPLRPAGARSNGSSSSSSTRSSADSGVWTPDVAGSSSDEDAWEDASDDNDGDGDDGDGGYGGIWPDGGDAEGDGGDSGDGASTGPSAAVGASIDAYSHLFGLGGCDDRGGRGRWPRSRAFFGCAVASASAGANGPAGDPGSATGGAFDQLVVYGGGKVTSAGDNMTSLWRLAPLVWSPRVHGRFGPPFAEAVRTLLLVHRREVGQPRARGAGGSRTTPRPHSS